MLLALIILVSLAVLAAADAWMIIKDDAERCGAQFPKWLGCLVANHESLSGSLITAGGALFAGMNAQTIASIVHHALAEAEVIAPARVQVPLRVACDTEVSTSIRSSV